MRFLYIGSLKQSFVFFDNCLYMAVYFTDQTKAIAALYENNAKIMFKRLFETVLGLILYPIFFSPQL